MAKIDAIVLGLNGKAYFFEGSQYSRYDLATFQRDPGYPQPIAGNWPGLWDKGVDCAFNWGTSGQVFFFRGTEYIGYDIKTDKIGDGYPKPIRPNWSGVWDRDIEAAVDWGNGKIFFFKGSEYIRYDINTDKADEGYPKPIARNWPGLWIQSIDAAVNWGNGKAYFFRKDEFLSYDIAADSTDMGYPQKFATGWPPSSGSSSTSVFTSTRTSTSTSSSTSSTSTQTESTDQLSAGRQNMIDLIAHWMPDSLQQPRVPEGEKQSLMSLAGWTKARGAQSKREKDAGTKVVTSCGDILAAMLKLWKSNFVGAFGIRDLDSRGRKPGAKDLGYYVEVDGTQMPKPGDIIVLRNGVGRSSVGSVGHVGILVEATPTTWRTADGGGGVLPDQTAMVTERTVRFENGVPILKSPTDAKEKQLDGWVDLDRLEQTG
jgi:hemopexin